jgi:thiopurine S-methyltransferase
VWDRACLVAVAPQRRRELVDVVRRVLAPGGRILLNVFDYDQGEMNGPPFAVPEAEVRQLFAGCTLTLLECRDGRSIFDSNPDRNFSRFDILTWLIELP